MVASLAARSAAPSDARWYIVGGFGQVLPLDLVDPTPGADGAAAAAAALTQFMRPELVARQRKPLSARAFRRSSGSGDAVAAAVALALRPASPPGDQPSESLPPPAPPPMSSGPFAPSFDDSSWELLDVPHDFLINGTYDGSNPGSGSSYIPRNNSYYRKHFKLPSEWQGGTVWLQFEGVFQKAQVYVNGVFMYADEDPGYNGFSIQLSGAGHVKYGAEENVIAMFVDGSPGSGWWCACQPLSSRLRVYLICWLQPEERGLLPCLLMLL
eukprot:SAG22_NODE_1679_length_3824_cov_6.607785_3_plen_269_part_00